MRPPPPISPNRKLAYNHLLYVAMLEIRGIQGFLSLRPKWRILSLGYWRRELRRIRYYGALANTMHNLALFSSYDFDRFDETWFWSQIDGLRARFPDMTGNFKQCFEHHLSELESGTSPEHAWTARAAPIPPE